MQNLRILISRPDRIGDVVLSTAIPREIKKKYPQSFIAVLLQEYTKDIYLNNPFVDEIIIYDEKINSKKIIKQIRYLSFTHSFMLLPQEKLNWIFFFSGIKYRVGVGHKFYQFVTNTKSVFRYKYKPLKHEAEYCMDFVRKLGISPDSVDPEIYLTEEEKERVEEFRKSISPSGEIIIGINSTSGRSAPNISVQEYRKLADILSEKKNIKIIITDLNPPEEFKDIKGVVYPNIGNTLRESFITFAALDYLISSSTGPMHISAALKVKTISLFSPLTACSPELWGPLGNKAYIILPDERYCRSICPGDPAKCDFSGAGGIDAEKIVDKVNEIIDI